MSGLRIRRMIIDESHSLFVDVIANRKKEVVDPFVLATRASNYSRIYLTATLAPKHAITFINNAGLEPNTKIIRMTTDRSNLAAYVLKPTSKDNISANNMFYNLISNVVHHLEQKAKWGCNGLAVIFDTSISKVTAISTHFDIPLYHSKLSEEEKLLNLRKWRSGDHQTIVATSALGTGIDYPNIRFVVFNGAAHGLYDYVQSAGRAGRDGEVSFIVTISDRLQSQENWKSDDQTKKDIRADMKKYLDHQGCRRAFITSIMDGGPGVFCEKDTDAACDQCQPSGMFEQICGWTRTREPGLVSENRTLWQPKPLAKIPIDGRKLEITNLFESGHKRALIEVSHTSKHCLAADYETLLVSE